MIEVIVVGLPKCGLNTISEYFHNAGYVVWAQWLYKESKHTPSIQHVIDLSLGANESVLHMASQILKQRHRDRPAAITQLDGRNNGVYSFPQIDLIDELLEQHPDAKFILNIRDINRHATSMEGWGGSLLRGVDLAEGEELSKWIEKTNQSQEAKLKKAGVQFIKLDIESPLAGERLDEFMELDNAHNWGHHNKSETK